MKEVCSFRMYSAAAWALALLGVLGLRGARAQSPGTGPFEAYWVAGDLPATAGQTWRDWAGLTQFAELPVRRDMYVMYQGDFGLYPYAGVHQVEADPDWMRRHFLRMQRWLDSVMPDVSTTGYGAIDYEAWAPCWSILQNEPSNQGPDARDLDFKDDWRDFIRSSRAALLSGKSPAQQEEVFESTYNDAARRFTLATLNEAKRLRPNLKWGFYCFPPRSYFDYLSPAGRAAWQARTRSQLQWLYDAQDVMMPDVYALYYTVAGRAPNPGAQEDDLTSFTTYVRNNVQEAIDLSQGKPVIPWISLRYHENCRAYYGQYLNDTNLDTYFAILRDMNVQGVAIWTTIGSDAGLADIQRFVNDRLVSRIRQYCTDSGGTPLSGARNNTSASSGGGGGGGAGGSSPPPPNTGSNNAELRQRPFVRVKTGDYSTKADRAQRLGVTLGANGSGRDPHDPDMSMKSSNKNDRGRAGDPVVVPRNVPFPARGAASRLRPVRVY